MHDLYLSIYLCRQQGRKETISKGEVTEKFKNEMFLFCFVKPLAKNPFLGGGHYLNY